MLMVGLRTSAFLKTYWTIWGMARRYERRIKERLEELGGVMAAVWADTRSREQQSQALREIATRLMGEDDPQQIRALIAELTSIVEEQVRTIPPN